MLVMESVTGANIDGCDKRPGHKDTLFNRFQAALVRTDTKESNHRWEIFALGMDIFVLSLSLGMRQRTSCFPSLVQGHGALGEGGADGGGFWEQCGPSGSQTACVSVLLRRAWLGFRPCTACRVGHLQMSYSPEESPLGVSISAAEKILSVHTPLWIVNP